MVAVQTSGALSGFSSSINRPGIISCLANGRNNVRYYLMFAMKRSNELRMLDEHGKKGA